MSTRDPTCRRPVWTYSKAISQASGFQVGDRKVLLGVPLNVRQSMAWRIAWLLGAIVSTATIIPLYQVIGRYATRTFYVWVAFQVTWLLSRSIYFHFADEIIQSNVPLSPISEDNARNPEIRLLVLALIGAVSQQMIPAHPRGSYCYTLDCNDPCIIMDFFRQAEWRVSIDALDALLAKWEIQSRSILKPSLETPCSQAYPGSQVYK